MAEVVLRRPYGSFETAGVAVLGVGGCISVLAIITFIVVMLRSKQISVGVIPRTHVGLYILCYLIADFVTSFASVLNLNWVSLRRVEVGPVCSFQGIVKQLGDVGTAIWSLVIALHLFNLLFWRWEPRKYGCYATLIGGWALTFMIAFIGPTTMKRLEFGDFYGIAGHWCWITQPYAKARFSLEYIWMFLSSAFSFLLYFLVFLRLRGNLYVVDGRLHFRMVSNQNGWQLTLTQDAVDRQIMQVVRLLLWFPVLYIFVMLPMAITRFIEMEDNSSVPFAATFVANIPFSLSGLLTTILLYYVRKAIPDHEQLPSFVVPRPNVRKSIAETGVQPFKLSSPTPSTPDEKQMMAGTRRQMGGIDATPEVVAPPPAPVLLRSPSPNSLVNQMKKPRKPVPLQRLRANSTGSVLNSVTSGSPATATTASPQKLSPLRTGEIPIGISFNDLGHGRRHSESSPASYRPVHDAGAFRKKWQGGDLKLSYSNLRPHEWKAPQK